MKKFVPLILILSSLYLTSGCTQYHAQGWGTGGFIGGFIGSIIGSVKCGAIVGFTWGNIGGITGTILDDGNPWRGGVIGGALGAVAGGILFAMSPEIRRLPFIWDVYC